MYPFIKRFFDVFFCGIGLILLSPLLLPIILVLRLTGEGEIFYLQNRIGYKNRLFKIYKFATMLKNSPNMGTGAVTLRNDPRVTTVGRYLRITKMNEFPQLLNVVKGDMSVVGPRPLMPISFKEYAPEVQAKIYDSKPGITGIGSVIFRDEEKWVTASGMDPVLFYQTYIFPYKGAVEMWYQRRKSLWVDTQLIFLTACAILFPENKFVYTFFRDLPRIPFPGIGPKLQAPRTENKRPVKEARIEETGQNSVSKTGADR